MQKLTFNLVNKLNKSQTQQIVYKFSNVSVKEMVGANPVRGFSLRFAELEKQNPKCINLALGVPMDPTFPSIVESKQKYVEFTGKTGNNGYGDPRGIEPLRKNLAQSFRNNYKQPEHILNENNIIIVPGGTSNALCLSMEKLLRGSNGEGEIIILAPFFGPYVGMVKLANGKAVIVDTIDEFQPDLEAIEKAINSNTKAILINSPNNPTGKIYPKETIEKIIAMSKKHNIALISDEIYKKFCYNDNKPFHSLKEYYQDNMDQNLIVVNAPSKTYGMIGDRIGYIVSNQTEFIEDIAITLGYRFASSPYLPQHAYNSIFDNFDEIKAGIESNRLKYKEKAVYLVEGLNKIGLNATELEGGMFAMTEVKSCTGMDGDQLSDYFLNQEAPVAVYPGSFFGSSYKDYLRFTTCPTQETLEKGLSTIEQYIKNIKK